MINANHLRIKRLICEEFVSTLFSLKSDQRKLYIPQAIGPTTQVDAIAFIMPMKVEYHRGPALESESRAE